ncbi:hypothetical protein LTR35_006400 [Friedmanniomyces endolithicus]|nr:hypothetical protein LTR35_006400 [Friedmanniomyces endolithicus]KAK0298591.1 hypothetical protein LTS00_002973 [Friedmanniomyces endolithicus]KAK1001546.1 hypothetical protein LTR54_008443 [Friedmanniomyces endolithicus]
MPRDPLIALVGKPSSGKSTTLNSLTDTTAKVGNFPFTTIEPNHAIGYLHLACACSRTSLPNNTPPSPSAPTPLHLRCKPNYGACLNGIRSVPIELLDVAGLVPGAHLGKGLGNKFLDDLRHADAFIHVVDVSGTTDQEGKATRGYDPSADIAWLRDEIVRWVLGNLMQKWGGLKRRHTGIKATAVETLQGQFSGYGSTSAVVARTLDRLALKQPLQEWDDKTIELVVNTFVDEKFPTVIALNKIDHPDADKNVAKIARVEPAERLVLCSAISEVFLRRLAKQGFVRYSPGSEFVDTREDLIEQGDPDGGGLKEMDEKLRTRIENLKDMVLYRFGSTGVNQVLTRASEVLGLVPVFPVRNIASFGSGDGGGAGERAAVFRDCVLVKKGSTVGDVYRKVMGDAPMAYVETVGGVRVGEDDEVGVGKNDISPFIPRPSYNTKRPSRRPDISTIKSMPSPPPQRTTCDNHLHHRLRCFVPYLQQLYPASSSTQTPAAASTGPSLPPTSETGSGIRHTDHHATHPLPPSTLEPSPMPPIAPPQTFRLYTPGTPLIPLRERRWRTRALTTADAPAPAPPPHWAQGSTPDNDVPWYADDEDEDGYETEDVSPRTILPRRRPGAGRRRRTSPVEIPGLGRRVAGVASRPWVAEPWRGGEPIPQRPGSDSEETMSADEVPMPDHILRSIEDLVASPSQHSPATRQALSMLNPGREAGIGLGITGLPTLHTVPRYRVPEVHWPEHRPVSRSSSFVYGGSDTADRDSGAYLADDSMSSSDDGDAVGGNDWEDDSRDRFMSARQTPEEGVFTLELHKSSASSNDSFTTAPQRPVNPTGSRSSSPFGVLRPAANGVLDYASVPMRRYVGNGLVDPLGRTERLSIFTEARMTADEEDADEDDMLD